jgi:hypothetical protein
MINALAARAGVNRGGVRGCLASVRRFGAVLRYERHAAPIIRTVNRTTHNVITASACI